MRVTTIKFGVSISFCRKLAIYGKTVRWHLCILSKNLKFSKSLKNSYRRPLCIADPEYGGHDQEIRSFGQFLLQTCDLRENRWLTPMGFERKFEKFKIQ
jgi:hypothetical protein